ncbi:MAG: hypothetical protein LC742_09500 [Acidobacteria bacterium]|nr:hypothetical protein [Acidobacteriota bacterium]
MVEGLRLSFYILSLSQRWNGHTDTNNMEELDGLTIFIDCSEFGKMIWPTSVS